MLVMACIVSEGLTCATALSVINLSHFLLCQHYFKRINEGLGRKKALSSIPKWTKLINFLEPNL